MQVAAGFIAALDNTAFVSPSSSARVRVVDLANQDAALRWPMSQADTKQVVDMFNGETEDQGSEIWASPMVRTIRVDES